MKEKIFIGIIFLAIAVFQISVWPVVFEVGWAPNFALVFLVYLSLGKGFFKNWRKAFIFGFILDLLYFWPPGINIASFTAAVFAVSSFSKRFVISEKGGFFLVSLGAVALASAVGMFFGEIWAAFFEFFPNFYRGNFTLVRMGAIGIMKSVFSNLIFFSLFFFPAEKIRHFLGLYQKNDFKKRF